MTIKQKKNIALLAIEALKQKYPDAICSLEYEKPYELLFAVRLSAQCTDARVNLVTPELFAKYKTVEDFAAANVEDVEKIIHSCGFFRAKAKDIVGMCQKMISPVFCRNLSSSFMQGRPLSLGS